jgi:endonuclease G
VRKLNKLSLWLFILLFLVSGCISSAKLASKNAVLSSRAKRIDKNEHILFGYPGQEKIVLYRKGYVLGYNPDKKIADWVSYHFTDAYCVKNVGRTEDFRADPDLLPGQRAELEDYKGSGYDRGHLAPAADMARDAQTMSESFLLSNMAPQVGVGFNRGIWKKLEERVRGWVRQRKNIYVFTGPIFSDSNHYNTIGPNHVAVPTHFYKILVSCTEAGENIDAIAFILPNQKNPDDKLPEFITSIDEIEKQTGLDFMHELDDDAEVKLEAKKAEMW